MKTNRNDRSGTTRGSAMLAVMGTVFGVLLVGATLGTLARNQVRQARMSRDYVRAQMIAESGANHAYSLLKTNFAARSSDANFPAIGYDGGSFDATVVGIGTNQASITSIGTYGTAVARTKVDVMNIPQVSTNGMPPPTSPWAYGLFCNGYARWNGTSKVNGGVHVNNYIDCNGTINWGTLAQLVYVQCSSVAVGFTVNGGATILGTVRAPRIVVTGPESIQTKVVEAVPTIPLPVLDLTSYYNTALANGQVFGSQTVNGNSDWGNIPGGVRWINGTLRINGGGHVKYTGCLIVTGNITLNGGLTQSKAGGMPALVSRDGTLTINGSHIMYGLVYSKGNMTYNGAGTITGTLIVGGNLTFNGAGTLNVDYMYCNPAPSPQEMASADYVVVTAWQE